MIEFLILVGVMSLALAAVAVFYVVFSVIIEQYERR